MIHVKASPRRPVYLVSVSSAPRPSALSSTEHRGPDAVSPGGAGYRVILCSRTLAAHQQ